MGLQHAPVCMDDEIFSLKVVVVSDVAAEREFLRLAARAAPVPVELIEIDVPGDEGVTRRFLASGSYDAVFLDSRISRSVRQNMLDAARASPGRPLAILIGAAAIRTREVLTDGFDVDGTLAKPIEMQELVSLIRCCVQARLHKRVLIVDDSSTVRAVVRKVLQASRFRLDAAEAGEGETALALARQRPFDIVFLDCLLPGIDGFETLAEFRRHAPATQVVMFTGMPDARIEDRARAEGATDFLYKPFFAKDVDVVLNRLFGLMQPRWN